MATITRILAPVDFSPGSKAALDYALLFADRFNAQLTILHVWEIPHTLRPDLMVWLEGTDRLPVENILLKQSKDEMEAFMAKLPAEARGRVQTRTEQGNVVRTIVQIAETDGFDLLVVGTHGRTGLAHVVMGSVAERVVRHASCPVLTVRMPKDTAE
ncbi:MAG TPA: universal stress protein [Polyangiaceae bacterium]